jgi:hypothetical protein
MTDEGGELERIPAKEVLAFVDEQIRLRDPERLDDARAKVAAAELYARQRGLTEQETEAARARLIVEAGLGALALDGVKVENGFRGDYNALGAALERGCLLNVIARRIEKRESLALSPVATAIRDAGWTFVKPRDLGDKTGPVMKWVDARKLALSKGIDLRSLKPCPEEITQRREAAKRMNATYRDAQRESRRQAQTKISKVLELYDYGPLEPLYATLRKALTELDKVGTWSKHYTRRDTRLLPEKVDAFYAAAYALEDDIGYLLRHHHPEMF